jgi:hypothetical protein
VPKVHAKFEWGTGGALLVNREIVAGRGKRLYLRLVGGERVGTMRAGVCIHAMGGEGEYRKG